MKENSFGYCPITSKKKKKIGCDSNEQDCYKDTEALQSKHWRKQVFTYSFAEIRQVIAHNHTNRRHLYIEQQTSVCLKTCANNKSHTEQSSASERNVRHICVCVYLEKERACVWVCVSEREKLTDKFQMAQKLFSIWLPLQSLGGIYHSSRQKEKKIIQFSKRRTSTRKKKFKSQLQVITTSRSQHGEMIWCFSEGSLVKLNTDVPFCLVLVLAGG